MSRVTELLEEEQSKDVEIKVVIHRRNAGESKFILDLGADIVAVIGGEEHVIGVARDLSVHLPLEGVVSIQAEMLISDIDFVDHT